MSDFKVDNHVICTYIREEGMFTIGKSYRIISIDDGWLSLKDDKGRLHFVSKQSSYVQFEPVTPKIHRSVRRSVAV